MHNSTNITSVVHNETNATDSSSTADDDAFSYANDDFWGNYNYNYNNNNNYNYNYDYTYEPPTFPWTRDDFDSILCTTDPSSQICLGDSGGPLVVAGDDDRGADDVQIGIVSWILGDCNKGEPGMYARVSTVYDWIERSVCRHSGNVPEWFDCEGVESLSSAGESASAIGASGGAGAESASASESDAADDAVDDADANGGNDGGKKGKTRKGEGARRIFRTPKKFVDSGSD